MNVSEEAQKTKSRFLLAGQRIYLREVCLGDVTDAYHRWMNDPETTLYLEQWGVEYSRAVLREYVTKLQGKEDEVFFAICLAADGKHIGNIKIGPVHPYHRRARVGLLIGEKEFWNRGYATQAIKLAADFGFEVLKVDKVEAGCHRENVGSCKAFQKAGFAVEGELEDHLVLSERPTAEICLGLTRRDWASRRRDTASAT